MAKKVINTIEIDIVTKGFDTAEKAVKNIDSGQGELYNKAQKVNKAVEKGRAIIKEYGDNMPVAKAKELEKYMRIISEETADMAEMDEIVIFNKKESENLRKIEDAMNSIKARIKEIQKLKVSLPKDMEENRIKELKTQKTVKGADGKSVSMDALRDKDGNAQFNSKADLEMMAKSSDVKVQKAAQAALHQLGITAQKSADKIKLLNEEEAKLNNTLDAKRSAYNDLATVVRKITDEEKVSFETVSKFTEEQVKQVQKVIEETQKQGDAFVKTSKSIDKHNASLGGAVKQLFSWTAIWNLGTRMLKEAVRTVTEMDRALTGMAVVTSMGREETMKLIPAIQNLSRETSTAMTEVANLITEYTRQGRTLTEAFVLAEETAKAAKIAGISAAESIQYMTSAINGFNLAATDATRVSDIFANLAAISATNYEQLAIALSKVSAQANLAGMSIEYTTALLAKGIETTQEAPESIGTALKTILARMRELSDYGKTLEDGGSVNKVENALASAGIQLRDVNGEFRDLQEIFNELGPKWDSLNTMQQQAIAQAVAGTRQQSRFVAIMQDWERTQELAAEAQDSAGASAAQYYEQAQGMEAAITNLTTAWQSFIQSLTSSKFIITVIKTATKLLDGLTAAMSIGGDFTKSLIAGIVSVIAITKALQKINKFREALANYIAQSANKEEKSNTEITKEKIKQLAAEKGISEEQAKQLLNNKKQLEFEKRRLQLKLKDVESDYNDYKGYKKAEEDEERLTKEGSIDDDAYIDAYTRMQEHGDGYNRIKSNVSEVESDMQKVKDIDAASQATGNVELEYNWKQKLVMLEQESQQIQLAKIDAQIQENEELKRKLEIENAITQAKIDQLNAEAGASTTTDERKAQIAKEVDKLTSKKAKNTKLIDKLTQKGNKLDSKRSKILKGEVKDRTKIKNILNTMVNKLGKKFGVDTNKISKTWKGLTGIFGKMKTQNDANNVSLSKLLTGEQQRIKNYDKMLESNKIMTEDGKEMEMTESVREEILKRRTGAEENIKNIQTAQKDLGTEGLVTQKQAGQLLNIEQATQEAVKVTQEGQVAAEGAENAAVVAGLPAETAEAGANIAASASQPYGVGLPFAIMGIALLAAVGLGAGIAGIISAASGAGAKKQDKAAEESIQKNSAAMYEKKKENATLTSDLEEYRELSKKSYKTEEENERLAELTESLQEADESFAGLTGEALVGAVSGKISDNTDAINHYLDANFESAAKMNNLNDSLIGQQAISAKLIDSQEDLIASNQKLWESNDKMINQAVTESSKSMAEDLASTINYDDYLKTDDFRADGYAAYIGTATAMGAAIGAGFMGWGATIGASVGALVGTIGAVTHDIINAVQREKEREDLEQTLKYYNSTIVDMAVTMESEIADANTSLADQIETYNSLKDTLADGGIEEQLLANQYGTLDFMNDITKADDQVLDNIKKLVELDAVTEDSIMRLAQTFSNFETKENELTSMLNKMNATSSEWGQHSNLASLAESYGAGENFTAQELRDKMMSEVKWNDDAQNYAKDNSGNYREQNGHGVNNEEFTNVIEYLDTIIGAGYGNMSADTMESLLGVLAVGNPSIMFTDIINSMADSIDESMDPRKQAQAMMDAYRQNSSKAEKYIKDTNKAADDLYAEADELFKAGKKEEANELRAQAAEYKKLAQEFETSLNDAYRGMVGDLNRTELNDFMEQLNSSLDNAKDVKEAISEGGEIDADGYAYLMDNVIPTLQKELGDAFDPNEFLKSALEGSVEALDQIDQYIDIATNKDLDKLARNVVTKHDAVIEATKELELARQSNDDKEIEAAEATLRLAEQEHAYAEARYAEAERTLKTEEEILKTQRKINSLERKRSILEEEDKVLKNYKNQLTVLKELESIYEKEREKAIEKAAEALNITKEELKTYIAMEKGEIEYNAELDLGNKLSENGLQILEEQLEIIYESDDAYREALDAQTELTNSWYETQIDNQSQLLDMYKSKLEDEQEALQDSLDKRRDMYEKYFDALDEQESDETFEEEQARLQRAIASLSTATDATSLTKLKEYQEQLQEVEDEQRQTERDRRRDAVSETLDNQSEAIDQYYEDRLENEQALWTEISNMQESEITDLMTKYNKEFQNATDLNKQYMLLSYKELHANIMAMMGDVDAANKAKSDLSNYKKYMERYASNPSIGAYDPKKSYSTGGIVDYTGLAMVHGSSSRPEAFLNASQTAMFSNLATNLERYYSKSTGITSSENEKGNVIIESFTIAVDATLTDNNVQQTGESLADALLEGLRRTGVSVNMKR